MSVGAFSPENINMNLRQEVVGIDQTVPLLDGGFQTYVNLDNAASTPPFRVVQEKTDEMMLWYSSVHRGTGFKSILSTQLYEQAREIVLEFVGARSDENCVIFCKNTTEALNRLANLFPFEPGDMVLTTGMEHHSNDLPWRARAEVIHSSLLHDGSLDLNQFQSNLEKYAGKIKLVTITGASNVTGFMPPIYDLAEMAHRHGAKIAVDCAQLLPHRPIYMRPVDSPRHLDFIAFSAHKVYAPLGSGGLIGEREFFNRVDPEHRGGGTVEIVTLKEVAWTEAPEKDEAGSPNVIGAVALASSLKFLSEIGMDTVIAHETQLTRYALEKLTALPHITLYGSKDLDFASQRVGVIPFQVDGVPHGKVAAILGYEGGIGVRNGCFCAHPYILSLLRVTDQEYRRFHGRVLGRDRRDLPGMIRISFGCYNNYDDVDRLVEMLERVVRGDYRAEYTVDKRTGQYFPTGFDFNSMREKYFTFRKLIARQNQQNSPEAMIMEEMTKWERIRAAIKGQETDRVCVALWRHFPVDDMTPDGLAESALSFQQEYDWDLIKFTPTGTYGVMDWGAETVYEPNNTGVRKVIKYGVTAAEQWPRLPKLDVTKGFYGKQNQALSLLARQIKGDVPVLQTIFSPLTTARKLAGDRIFTDLRTAPDLFKQGLEVITEVTIQFTVDALKSGADGLFFATQLGSYRLLSEAEYREFGEAYDRRILEAVKDRAELLVIHIHGEDTMYPLLMDYPVNIANWHDRITAPTITEARKHFTGLLAGGINEWNTLVTGPDSAIEAEVQNAASQVNGRGLMIAPGCVVPSHAPKENLMVVRKAVEALDLRVP